MKKIMLPIAVLAIAILVGYFTTTFVLNNDNLLAAAMAKIQQAKPTPNTGYTKEKDECASAREEYEKAKSIMQDKQFAAELLLKMVEGNPNPTEATLNKLEDAMTNLENAEAKASAALKKVIEKCGKDNVKATSTPATTTPTSTPSTSGPTSKPTNPTIKATPPKK